MRYLILLLLISCQNQKTGIRFHMEPSIYEEKLEVIIAPRDYMQYMDSLTDYNTLDGLTVSSQGQVNIWLPAVPQTEKEHATAAHELFHATFAIMQWVNIPLTDDTEEAYAYLLANLTKQFYEGIK